MTEEFKILDCQGLNCPMPIAKLTKEIKNLQPGQKVKVLVTDKGFEMDIKSWIKITGNILESLEKQDGVYIAIITKA